MTDSNITPSPLVYNGEIIHQQDEMLSLTDMWKASGSDPSRRPTDWLTSEAAARFVGFLAESMGIPEGGNSHFGLVTVVKGGSSRGSTLAHWQVGLAYAKYLSPEFHVWGNSVIRERMIGAAAHRANLPADIVEQIRRTDGISRMLSHKLTEMEKVNASLMATLSAQTTALAAITAVMQPPHPILVRHGKTAGEIWRGGNFPPIKITCWFGNRLKEQGCLMEGRAEVGGRTIRLFDPDKAEAWLRNGGRLLVEQKLAERAGQTKLRLIPTPPQPSGVQ